MTPIITAIEVDRPAADVFAYATDPTRFHEWQKGVVSGHLETTEQPRLGDRCLTTRKIGGAERASTSVVDHVDPPETWGVRGIDGPIRAEVDVVVKPISVTRTHLTISVDFVGHGIGKVLIPLVVRRQAEREMPKNLAELKRQMEKAQSR